MEDVDQLKNTISDLNEEIHRLNTVIANLPGSIYWKDKNGVYLGRNTYSMEKMQSVHLEGSSQVNDIVGKTDYDFFPKEVADAYRKSDIEAMETKTEISREESTHLPDGSTIIQLSRKRPMYNQNNQVIGIIGNTVDITEIKKIEEDLRKAKNEAEQVNVIKTEFIRNMEHDLRTPFSGVLGMSELLALQETDPEKKEILDDIVASAQALYHYCNEIIDYSRIESGSIVVVDKKFSLGKLIKHIIQAETPAIKHKGLTIKVTLDEKMPAIIIGDKRRIHRVLLNLIGNAIKFTQQGTITVTSQLVEKHAKKAIIRLIVADTDIGIPEEQQELVFEKFSRLTLSNKGLYHGMGVGLRIVKQFMYDMEGEIDLISTPGKGTRFSCTIPVTLPLTHDYLLDS